jgi:hypothetical protein
MSNASGRVLAVWVPLFSPLLHLLPSLYTHTSASVQHHLILLLAYYTPLPYTSTLTVSVGFQFCVVLWEGGAVYSYLVR